MIRFYLYIVVLLMLAGYPSCKPKNETSSNAQETAEPMDETLKKITATIEANPNDDKLYIERANYYLAIDSVELALRDITLAIDINNQHPDHYIILSEAYLALGNPDRCLEGLEKALEVSPQNKEALLKKAQLFLIMRQYDKTYETIRELIANDNFNPTAYYIRSYALLEQGDTANAIRNLLVAIDQKQDYFEAFMQLGIIYSNQRNPLATDYLLTAIELKPESPEAYYQLGLFFQENGEPAKAVEIYNNLLNIEPRFTFAIYNLGYIYLVYYKEFENAVNYFSRVLELDPGNFEALYNRGYGYELMGKTEAAKNDYRRALELKANYNLAIQGLNRLE